jgi:hypothetical protein
LGAFRINSSIVNLSLQSNNLGNTEAAQLCEVLSVTNTITKLSLGHNRITDAGVAHFTDLLLGPSRKNSSLVVLDLFGNQIGDGGATILAHALVRHCTVDLCARVTGVHRTDEGSDVGAIITASSCLDKVRFAIRVAT